MLKQFIYLTKIWKNQYKDQTQFQKKRLKELVAHAYNTTTYYKELLDSANIKPKDIKSLKDLKKIPITTKIDLKKAQTKAVSNIYKVEDLLVQETSGSTSIPLKVYRTKNYITKIKGSKLRSYIANGFRYHHKTAYIAFHKSKKRFFHKLGVHRYYTIKYDDPIKKQAKDLCELNPKIIEGYPSRIAEIGKYMIKNNMSISPKTIFTTSETMTSEAKKNIIKAFGITPTNIYATNESKFIAWECDKHEGFHINTDHVILEIVDEEGLPAKTGKGQIVITDLHNFAMPLIRYNIKDIGTLGKKPCSCKRKFPLLKELQGKMNEFFVLKNKEKVLGTQLLSEVVYKLPGIHDFQAVQEDLNNMTIYIKKAGAKVTKKQAEEVAKEYFKNININIKFVKELKRTKAGKFFSFISKVKV